MRVAVIGAGRVGTALAVLLQRSGYELVGVSGREATLARAARFLGGMRVESDTAFARGAEVVIVAVPDDGIASVVAGLAADIRPGTWVLHVSGAAGLEVLAPVLDAGGRRLAVHPLQTFPDVDRAIASIPGSTAAITADDDEGYALGEQLARDVGAEPFRLEAALRPLYHAAAVFASNYLVVTSAMAEQLLGAAGVPDPARAMAPLQRSTLENVEAMGPGAALTGPAVRGDAGTVASNLEALATHAPATVPAYVAMCRVALDLAVGSGRLKPEARARVDEVLSRWS